MAYRWQQDRGNYGRGIYNYGKDTSNRSWERPKPAAHHGKGNKEEASHNPQPNSSANHGDDDDNHRADHADRYEEMHGSRWPGYNVSHRSNQPWERSKDPADDDTGNKEDASHKPQPISSAAGVTNKYPGDDDGGAYATHTSRWSAYNASQPSHRQWERSKAPTGDDHRSDNKEEASHKPPPNAPAARATGKREENKDERAAGRYRDDPRANRHHQNPNPRQFGYGRSNPSVSFSQGDDQEEGDDEKKLREDYATRFALSPGRQHVVANKSGAPSHGEQPKVVVVKKLELHLEHNKIENFKWRKGGNGGGKKH